ncbi:hypothetical protein ACLB2K_001583 [Fragaria x ananassa]
MLVTIQQQIEEVEFEGDCALILQTLSRDVDDLSEVGAILADCKHYMIAFNFISLRHVYREANGVTHRLVHLASTSMLDEFWVEDTPVIIQDVLVEDD